MQIEVTQDLLDTIQHVTEIAELAVDNFEDEMAVANVFHWLYSLKEVHEN